MGVKIKGEYLGNTKVKIIHESGHEIITCAPKDNRGDGSEFSPTDLAVTSLGSCVLTIMSFVAVDNNIKFEGARFEAEKVMSTSPRMIKEILLDFYLPSGIPEKIRKKLENSVFVCPVKRSLHPDVEVKFNFFYGDR